MSAQSRLRPLWRAVKPCPETVLLAAIALALIVAFEIADLGAAYVPILVALLVGLHAALRDRVLGESDQ